MREPTCIIKPITYTSICSSREPTKENPVQALSHSVSFGRFVSESLAWDRWTLFSSKRYVEEAERFSQPGSVAEKKAFFEAHYQRMAGKKHNPDLINQLDIVQNKPENNENNDKETAANKENESKSNVSMETKKNECVGELDVTKIGSREEKKKHGELKSMTSSEGSESSQEALIPKTKDGSSENENPPQRRKTTITWLMPVCISPAAISAKYRSSIAKSDKKAPKSPIPAIAENKSDPKKRFFLAAQFSRLWSKCRTKLLCAIPSRLGRKDKSARKNTEKIEKKPIEKKARKWFQCLRFNSGSSSTNHQKEKAQSENRKKRMGVTCPKLCIKK